MSRSMWTKDMDEGEVAYCGLHTLVSAAATVRALSCEDGQRLMES